jgi:hypothetical protein
MSFGLSAIIYAMVKGRFFQDHLIRGMPLAKSLHETGMWLMMGALFNNGG